MLLLADLVALGYRILGLQMDMWVVSLQHLSYVLRFFRCCNVPFNL